MNRHSQKEISRIKSKKFMRRIKIIELLLRDGNQCFYCGIHLYESQITIEHLKAKSLGGTDNLKNLVIACKACNLKHGIMPKEEKLKCKYISGSVGVDGDTPFRVGTNARYVASQT